jgi:hypothetical protein
MLHPPNSYINHAFRKEPTGKVISDIFMFNLAPNIDFYCWFKDLAPYGSPVRQFTPRDILSR